MRARYLLLRPAHAHLPDLNAREDFEREIVVKVNVPELVRAELARPSWKGEHVALGTNTDPYQWVEGRYRLMEGIWEAMRDFANPCSVLTKSPLLLRDIELMQQISRADRVRRQPLDPDPGGEGVAGDRAAHAAPAQADRGGRRAQPGRDPDRGPDRAADPGRQRRARARSRSWSRRSARPGAESIGGVGLHLRGEVREIWFDWLRQYRPDLVPRYERALSPRRLHADRTSASGSRPAPAAGAGRGGSRRARPPGRRIRGEPRPAAPGEPLLSEADEFRSRRGLPSEADERVEPTTESAIELRGVVKTFGSITAVDELDLDVPRASASGCSGPNGAGKSTTMRLLTGQAIADSGEIRVLEFELPREAKAARAEMGVVPQLDNLDVDVTVEDNLAVFARLYRVGDVGGRGRPRARRSRGCTERRRTRSTSSRAACAAGCCSPAGWCTSRGWCCSTSPPSGSTRRSAPRCGR